MAVSMETSLLFTSDCRVEFIRPTTLNLHCYPGSSSDAGNRQPPAVE